MDSKQQARSGIISIIRVVVKLKLISQETIKKNKNWRDPLGLAIERFVERFSEQLRLRKCLSTQEVFERRKRVEMIYSSDIIRRKRSIETLQYFCRHEDIEHRRNSKRCRACLVLM